MDTVKTLGRVGTLLVALVGVPFFAGAPESVAALEGEGTEKNAGSPQVTGFRSALFGMSQSDTLEAIQRDFQLEEAEIVAEPNDEDRTSSLMATVPDLFPGSGPARVVYIHGYQQKKLIQVNILWGLPVTDAPDPQRLVSTANILRKYFSELGFASDRTLINRRIDDSVFIVFRATDDQQRMVLLQLISGKVAVAEDDTKEPQNQVVSLWLSYIENTEAPDTFSLEKGLF